MDGVLSSALAQQRLKVVGPLLRGRVMDYGCGEAAILGLADVQHYTGVDNQTEVLDRARQRFPEHRFISPHELEQLEEKFDTIISVATIGLIDDQVGFLKNLRRFLAQDGQIILTSPDPRVNWVHRLGGKLGFFSSKMGYDSARQLPTYASMEKLAAGAGLTVSHGERFMLGMNQLFIVKSGG